MRIIDAFFSNFLMPCFELYVCRNCKLASRPFQIVHYSYATSSSQLFVMTLRYILMFDMLLIVNVSTFVVVLWLFRFGVYLDCPLLWNIYHPLLARFLLHILAHSLPLNIWTGLIHHFLLIIQKKILLFFSFMWNLEVIWLL